MALRIDDRGSTLVIVAGAMVALLAMSALAIDLVTFYAVRAEAQRAADAAALAGAQTFVTSGCTSAAGGCVAGGAQEATAKQRAQDAGAQNRVAGQAANIRAADVTFSYPNPQEPQITVVARRDSTAGNAMPTIFGKILGIQAVNISVSATAEAFNSSGSGLPIGSSCLKPWILPNCDPLHTNFPALNPNCGGKDPFVNPSSGSNQVNPGPAPAGVVGEEIVIKPGKPGDAPAPSQFYPVDLPPSTTQPSICPQCAGSGGGGGALYRNNIECCNENTFVCGPVPVNFEHGDMKGPTKQGVQCLIAGNQNASTGQDILVSASPLSITGGSANPNPALRGQTGLQQSKSLITLPLYNGIDLCPGNSCGPSVTIIGFLQAFVEGVDSQGNVTVKILNTAGCGTSGSTGGTPTTVNGGGSFVPVRLIHQ